MLLLLALLAACAEPDACTPMCAAAGQLYGGCLQDWGADWEAAAYADEADFLDACDTWAWEMHQLERDAGRTGATDAACAEREAALTADDATCESFTGIDWHTPPWEQK
jgi:hypothetical protein